MGTAQFDRVTGRILLSGRSGDSLLLPLMRLHQFAQTPIVRRCFRKGFEKRHSTYGGYFIGAYDFAGLFFNIALGFTSPSTLCLPEDCSLESVSLHPCNARMPSGLLDRVLSACGFQCRSVPLTEAEAAARCTQWLAQNLGQAEEASCYEPWGHIRRIREHPYYGCHISIAFAN
jgi:hypothetical protein